ncbi:MAG: hypothetical protein ACRDVW_10760 [Acidimicrobiales bacterium]
MFASRACSGRTDVGGSVQLRCHSGISITKACLDPLNDRRGFTIDLATGEDPAVTSEGVIDPDVDDVDALAGAGRLAGIALEGLEDTDDAKWEGWPIQPEAKLLELGSPLRRPRSAG